MRHALPINKVLVSDNIYLVVCSQVYLRCVCRNNYINLIIIDYVPVYYRE